MNTLFMSIMIGLIAGTLDIIPMIIQKLPVRASLSAFLQYFFVSIVIINIDLPGVVWWLEGGLISLAMAIPVIIIVSENDKKVIPIISSMAIILGTTISLTGHFFI